MEVSPVSGDVYVSGGVTWAPFLTRLTPIGPDAFAISTSTYFGGTTLGAAAVEHGGIATLFTRQPPNNINPQMFRIALRGRNVIP